MNVFSKAFLLKALENALVAGASAFTGTVAAVGAPSIHTLIAGSVAGGLAILYTFIKEFGVVQAVKQGVVSVIAPAGRHTAP